MHPSFPPSLPVAGKIKEGDFVMNALKPKKELDLDEYISAIDPDYYTESVIKNMTFQAKLDLKFELDYIQEQQAIGLAQTLQKIRSYNF